MNKFKVNEALIPYLKKLHDRKGITCQVLYDNGTCYMRTPLSGNAFHRQVKVARCQKKEKEEMVDYLDKDLPRSFIVLEDNRVLLSRISTSGLKIRLEGDSDFYGE